MSRLARASEITLKLPSSSGDNSKIPLFRIASCNLVSSTAWLSSSSCFCFLDNLGSSSGHIVYGRVIFCSCVERPFTHVYPSNTLVLKICNLVFQPFPQRVQQHFLHANNRSMYCQMRRLCLFASASSRRVGNVSSCETTKLRYVLLNDVRHHSCFRNCFRVLLQSLLLLLVPSCLVSSDGEDAEDPRG